MSEPRLSVQPSNPVDDGSLLEAASGNAEGAATESAAPASREEQLARFEDALKEEDWGHQPC